jgi:hypothetical protein
LPKPEKLQRKFDWDGTQPVTLNLIQVQCLVNWSQKIPVVVVALARGERKFAPQFLPSLQGLVGIEGIEGLKFEAWYITIRGCPAELLRSLPRFKAALDTLLEHLHHLFCRGLKLRWIHY